jgi:isopentenyldiphosphate isomerase
VLLPLLLLPLTLLQVQWNAAEVSEVQFVEWQDLRAQMQAQPQKFTQWFREELQLLNFFRQDPECN